MCREDPLKLGQQLGPRPSRTAVAYRDAKVRLNDKNGGRNPVVAEAPIAPEARCPVIARQPAEPICAIPPRVVVIFGGVEIRRRNPFDRDDPAGFGDRTG
jgi:hypothetical protein